MVLNTIYAAFNGEVCARGIGSPCIFLRLAGCHLRCYKQTLDTLCDTPEALSRKGMAATDLDDIMDELMDLSNSTGIRMITLSGGDPLWNKTDELTELFTRLTENGLEVSVETSGTISWLPYADISKNIHWVLDYKLKSTGVKASDLLFKDGRHLHSLKKTDFIKFVVYDMEDFEEFTEAFKNIHPHCNATIAVGAYWGGKLNTFQIFDLLKERDLLGFVTINMQAHKALFAPDYSVKFPEKI